MIEVEKKFKKNEKIDELIKKSTFLCNLEMKDIYYDFKDLNLIKNDIRFRFREIGGEGKYELKVRNKKFGDFEINDEDEIKKYFNTELSLEEFINQDLIEIMNYETHRQKYANGEFILDLDTLTTNELKDFKLDVCEIELMVKDESEVKDASKKIDNFAELNGLEKEKISKREVYLRAIRPEVFKELEEGKVLTKEFKMK